jgi:hypothetical protein
VSMPARKSLNKKLFGRPRCGWTDNIKMCLTGRCVIRYGLDSFDLRKGQVVVSCKQGNETLGYIEHGHFLTS